MSSLQESSHSGDYIDIIVNKGLPRVLKIFKSDLKRANRNIQKQKNFIGFCLNTISIEAAEVVEFSITDKEAKLVMPYILGITGNQFAISATRPMIEALTSAISAIVRRNWSESNLTTLSIELFQEKLLSVAKSNRQMELADLIKKISELFKKLPQKLIYPIGPCHGDLTLSNIILTQSSSVVLIDFLDSYLESPLQDVAKVKQDFVHGWSFRKSPEWIQLKAEIFCKTHRPQIIDEFENTYPVQLWITEVLSLARIAPYVNEELTKNWLMNALQNTIKQFPKCDI